MRKHIFLRLFIVLFIINSYNFIRVRGSTFEEIDFPSGVKTLEYNLTKTFETKYSNVDYSYIIESNYVYYIIDVDSEENTFTIKLDAEIYLRSYEGIVAIGVDILYYNGTVIRNRFSEHRSKNYSITRKVDSYDGKILLIYNKEKIPDNITFVYRLLNEQEEKTDIITSGIANNGAVPFIWMDKNEAIESEIIILTTPVGVFESLKTAEIVENSFTINTAEKYYDKISGILLNSKTVVNLLDISKKSNMNMHSEIIIELTKIEYGRTWDRIIIYLMVLDDRIDVGEEPTISSMAQYAYDNKLFNGEIKLSTYNVDTIGSQNISVLGVVDDIYGITDFITINYVEIIFDRVRIFEGGVSNSESKTKQVETVWFRAEYEYDAEPLDDSNGVLYMNDEPMGWSSFNQRWEKEVVSDDPDTLYFEITGIQDNAHGLSNFNDVVGTQSIRWKSAGIPGFQFPSIIIGCIIAFLILFKLND